MKEHGMTPDTEKGREEIMNELTRMMYAELENADQGGESSDPGEKAEDSSDKQEMESFLDFLSRMASGEEDGEDDDDEEENDDDGFVFGDDEQPEREMDADDYHNRAVGYAREHRFAKAVQICEEGLFTYPDNVDLLADAVKYCAENGDKPRAQKHYEKLCAVIPRSRFNWRAFTFSLDYLMLDAEENESECRSLLEDYAKALPFEENIAKTAEVVRYAHMVNVSVEGELGTIGDTGTSIEGGMTEVIYTDPDDAKKFVEETGVDTLAVAIGTCHGLYPKGVTPKLRMDVLKAIKEKVDLPLVLHGGSGNPDSEIAEAVKIGIQKVNISSDYKSAFFIKAREILSQEGSGWDPNNLFPACIEAGKEVIKHKMELFGCVGAAKYYRDPVTPQWRQELA